MKHLTIALGLLAAFPVNAQTRKVLFIGNSYTSYNNLPELVRQLALSMGDTLTVASSTPGGHTFQQHCTNATTQGLIAQQAWDFVVLQEQSQLPSFPDGQVAQQCLPFAAQLVDTIRAYSPCAEAVFYMTWGRENGDASNCATWPPVCTYDGMQALLRERYLQMAVDNDAFAAPVGAAWKRIRELHPGIGLYVGDGSHPNPSGSYLAAATICSTIMRRSCSAATYTAGLQADTAALLRSIASGIVLDSVDTWNIGVNDPDAGFTYDFSGPCMLQFTANGDGLHAWTFGDGAASTEASPVHAFSPGNEAYIVTHQLADACGRTSSDTLAVAACLVGVNDPAAVRIRPLVEGRTIRFNNVHPAARIVLHRTDGGLLAYGNAATALVVPAGGPVAWQLIQPDGTRSSGLLFIP